MAAQKKYPDELREIRRIWGNYVPEDLNTQTREISLDRGDSWR